MGQRSVVLLSGGLDSAANLALCRLHDEPVLALTADYGQRAARREIDAARALAQEYGVEHKVIDLQWLGALGGSSLTDPSQAMPEIAARDLDNTAVAEQTARGVWVPNRNGVLINVAAAFAERTGCSQVVVGFNREEAQTFPDNSGDFMLRATSALELSTRNGVEVRCYTMRMDKREIVAELRAKAPSFRFGLVWSCYEGAAERCGVCESCRRFARAVGGTE